MGAEVGVGVGMEAPTQALDSANLTADFIRIVRASVGRGDGGEGRGDDVAWHSNVFVWGGAMSTKAMQLVAIGEPLRPISSAHVTRGDAPYSK